MLNLESVELANKKRELAIRNRRAAEYSARCKTKTKRIKIDMLSFLASIK